MNKLLFSSLAFVAVSFAACGDPTVDLTDKIMTITVPLGEEYVMPDTDQLKPASVTNVVKKGAGTLKWTTQAKNYRGEIHIDEGTLNDASVHFLGESSELTNVTLYIASGATWSVTRPNGGIETYPKVDVADGAILSFTKSPRFHGGFVLHGNTTFDGSCSFSEGVLDMNGFNLTGKVSALNVTDVRNPGTVTTSTACEGPGLGYIGSSAAPNVVLVNKAFTFNAADDTPCHWNISFSPYAGSMTLKGGTRLDGTLTAGSGKALTITQNVNEFHLFGTVTASSVTRSRAEATELYLHAANEIGAIYNKGGVIVAVRPDAIPATANLTFDDDYTRHSGYALCPATAKNPDGWTADGITAFLDAFTSTGSGLYFGIAALDGDQASYGSPLGMWTHAFYFGGYGRGTTTLRSDTSQGMTSAIKVASSPHADFRISGQNGGDVGIVYNSVQEGRISYVNAGAVTYEKDTSVGTVASMNSKPILAIGAGTALKTTNYLRFPNKASGRAAFEILPNAVVTNANAFFGGVDSATASCFLRGGEWVPSTVQTSWGADSLAYLEQSGGIFRASTVNLAYGSNGAGGVAGLFYQKGGELVAPNGYNFAVGMGSTGVVYQTGGKMIFGDRFYLTRSFSSADNAYGAGYVTFAGGLTEVSNVTLMADRKYSTAAVNLMGSGVLATPQVRRVYGTCYRGSSILDESGNMTTKTYVNFNGGTLKSIPNTKALDGIADEMIGTGDFAPDRVTIYAGGATFDTNGRDMKLSVPLLAPTAGSVQSVSLPDGAAKLSGYMAAPYVSIDGDGTGATAVAEFDSLTGEVTGITVTSPGWGYTAANTTATLWYGQDSSARELISLEVTVAAEAGTGGLTKKGAGTLTLNSAANTYAGATTIEDGTLKLGVANALPNANLVMKGGALAVADGVDYPDGLVFDVSGITLDDSVRRVVLAENWTGALPTVVGLNKDYVIKVVAGKLVLARSTGILLIVR